MRTRRLLARPLQAALLLVGGITPGCTCTEVGVPRAGAITSPWEDRFDGASLGPDWNATDDKAYRIENGELVARGAHNHPLWLARPIPRDAVVEFDCWSNDPAGDLKVEIWGDGRSHADDLYKGYTSTAYNFIFGGWHNTISTLARLDEHGADRRERRDVKVERGRRYHWTITRKGGHIEWKIDGQLFLSLDDPKPLEGPDHAHFAINDWEAEVRFDNLRIAPAP